MTFKTVQEIRHLDYVLMNSFSFRITSGECAFCMHSSALRIKRKCLIETWILMVLGIVLLCIIWLRSKLEEAGCYNYKHAPFRIKSLKRSARKEIKLCKRLRSRRFLAKLCAEKDRGNKEIINQKTVSGLFNYWCLNRKSISRS